MLIGLFNFISKDRFYLQSILRAIDACFYALLLFKMLLELSLFSGFLTATFSILLVVGYGISQLFRPKPEDQRLAALIQKLATEEESNLSAQPYAAIVASMLLSVVMVIDLTQTLHYFLLVTASVDFLVVTRLLMTITVFRYLLQKILECELPFNSFSLSDLLKHVSFLKNFSFKALKTNLSAFSTLHWSFMCAMMLIRARYPLVTKLGHAFLIVSIGVSMTEVVPAIVLFFLAPTYLIVFPGTSLVSWMLSINLVMLLEEFMRYPTSTSQNTYGYFADLAHYGVTEIIKRGKASMWIVASSVHAATEALYLTSAMQNLGFLAFVPRAASYIVLYLITSWQFHQDPLLFWQAEKNNCLPQQNPIKSKKFYLLVFPIGACIVLSSGLEIAVATIIFSALLIEHGQALFANLAKYDFSSFLSSFLYGAAHANNYRQSVIKLFAENNNFLHIASDHSVLCRSNIVVFLSSFCASWSQESALSHNIGAQAFSPLVASIKERRVELDKEQEAPRALQL